MRNILLTTVGINLLQQLSHIEAIRPGLSCYNEHDNSPRHCQPPFENIAFQKNIEASDTCGTIAQKYCVQTGASGATQVCKHCDQRSSDNHHNSSLLTDFNNVHKITWWQSQSMLHGDVQYPNTVNLTLNLEKAFEITYVRLRFHSPRPESFAIYKKTSRVSSWIPYQYYSGSCDTTYPSPDGQRRRFITHENEQVALCTSDYSDISPLTGGSVAFSTLLARPSAYQFDKSPVLQDWVTAESIRITLNRINTFGDEIFHDPKVLQSYYYAISDLTIGGRCKCNGHASECKIMDVTDQDSQTEIQEFRCDCQHFTTGRDCEMCLPLYNDRHWGRATGETANECQKCECNGLADSCIFDATELARTNGTHGGICIDCRENTAGNHCELCLENFYKNSEGKCVACECNELGSTNLQCNSEGRCECKTGVHSDKCNQCEPGFHSMNRYGCEPCSCDGSGSVLVDGSPVCNPENGQCQCKHHVQGKRCDVCRVGFMNLQMDDEYGCYPCFCYSHIDRCEPSNTHYRGTINSMFAVDRENWSGEEENGKVVPIHWSPVQDGDGVIQITSAVHETESRYFVLPEKYVGEQRFSYGQYIEFIYSLNKQGGVMPPIPEPMKATEDIGSGGSADPDGFQEDGFLPYKDKTTQTDTGPISREPDLCFYPSDTTLKQGLVICTAFSGQGNNKPTDIPQLYRFNLHELKGNFFIRDRPNEELTHFTFMSVLDQLDKITIRATSGGGQIAELDTVKLDTAWLMNNDDSYDQSQIADWVEACETWAMSGYTGQYAQRCAAGYTRQEINGTAYVKCVQCNCNGHSETCDGNDGLCECMHHTTGRHCDSCEKGWYGDATRGFNNNEDFSSEHDCKACPCPMGATCYETDSDENENESTVKCINCPDNSIGDRCERCKDTYYGDPIGHQTNSTIPCKKCDCHKGGNKCDPITGVCLQCGDDLAGDHCEVCAKNYWGDATGTGCSSCSCDLHGTRPDSECNQETGACDCLPYVTGFKCDECDNGYYNITSDAGCLSCNCLALGSENNGVCDKKTGHCECKPGVTGEKCDKCMDTYYGMDNTGCKPCNCDGMGAVYGNDTSCDETGQCQCIDGVIGKHCDMCQENYYMNSITPYCLPCDECYMLVQDSVNDHRSSLRKIKDLIQTINSTVSTQVDTDSTDFRHRLEELLVESRQLKESARDVKSKWDTAKNQVEYIDNKVALLTSWTGEINDNLHQCNASLVQSDQNHHEAKRIINGLEEKLANVSSLLNNTVPFIREAESASEKLSDKFNEINAVAEDARRLAADHQGIHDEIKHKIETAITNAQASIDQINDSIMKAESLRSKINLLRDRLPQIRDRLNKLNEEAKSSVASTEKAKARANQILGKANSISIQNYDVDKIETNAENLDDLVLKIRPQIDSLATSFELKKENVNREADELDQLYTNAVNWQQEVDQLLAEVMKSKSIILNSQQHYNNAKDMSVNFDVKKAEAEQLWKQFDTIQTKVVAAQKSVMDVRSRLQNLYDISQDAHETAKQAETELEELTSLSTGNTQKYDRIIGELESTEEKIGLLKKNVDIAMQGIGNRKKQVDLQLMKTNAARTKAQEARSMAAQAMNESTDALKLLKIIRGAIDQLPDTIDREEELLTLDEDLNYIEQKLNSADIDNKILRLEQKNQEVKGSLSSFSQSATTLAEKKLNLQEILDKIPHSCPFRTQRTEDMTGFDNLKDKADSSF